MLQSHFFKFQDIAILFNERIISLKFPKSGWVGLAAAGLRGVLAPYALLSPGSAACGLACLTNPFPLLDGFFVFFVFFWGLFPFFDAEGLNWSKNSHI